MVLNRLIKHCQLQNLKISFFDRASIFTCSTRIIFSRLKNLSLIRIYIFFSVIITSFFTAVRKLGYIFSFLYFVIFLYFAVDNTEIEAMVYLMLQMFQFFDWSISKILSSDWSVKCFQGIYSA